MADALKVLSQKLSSGVITQEEHDAILDAHIRSTRPESMDEGHEAVVHNPLEIKLCVATFNLGNAPLDPSTLHLWIDPAEGYDLVAVGLQESWTGSFTSFAQSGGSGSIGGGRSVDKARTPDTASPTAVLEQHLGPTFTKLVETSRGEMKLVVFNRTTPKQPVHSVEVSAENTGALGIAPNKGGLMARCVYGVTSICFIACHLQAHEGSRNYAARNKSCEEILSGARVGNRLLDATTQHHHTFFFGDLNYRVDLALPMSYDCPHVQPADIGGAGADSSGGPGCERPWTGDDSPGESSGEAAVEGVPTKQITTPSSGPSSVESATAGGDGAGGVLASDGESGLSTRTLSGDSGVGFKVDTGARELAQQAKFELATTLISLGGAGLKRLLAHDELLQALLKQETLGRFITVAPQFPPTFKVVKGEVEGYNPKRIPSWCDRVLWCSLPGVAKDLQLTDYSAAAEVTSSDHKPVTASFRLCTAPPVLPPRAVGVCTAVHLTNLAATDLPVMDGVLQGGKADPYVELIVLPPIAGSATPVRTAVIPKDLNPKWAAPLVSPIYATPESAGGVHVVLCVKDRDIGSTDDVIGSACLSLGRAMAAQQGSDRRRFHFDEPLFHNGMVHGSIKGTLEIIFSEAVS
eukprot:m.471030 g.471030  ORF g.471030 m.471030 type:complete len:635 (+) comp30503_c0_seq1:218-2122(+)